MADPTVVGAYCGDCNGSITVNLAQGESPDVMYSIDNGFTWQSSNFFDNSCITDHLILADNTTTAEPPVSNTAQVPSAPDLNMLKFSYTCLPNENKAEAIMEISGGTAEYLLSYIDPLGQEHDAGSSMDSIAFIIEDLRVGDYHFFVEDRLGCVKDSLIRIYDDCLKFPTGAGNQLPLDFGTTVLLEPGGNLNIQINGLTTDENVEVNIFSASGRFIYHRLIENSTEWLEKVNLDRGLYFIKLNSNSGKSKLLKTFIF